MIWLCRFIQIPLILAADLCSLSETTGICCNNDGKGPLCSSVASSECNGGSSQIGDPCTITSSYSCAGTLASKASIDDLRYDFTDSTTHSVGDYTHLFDNSKPSQCPVYDCSLTLSDGNDASEHGPEIDEFGQAFEVKVSSFENQQPHTGVNFVVTCTNDGTPVASIPFLVEVFDFCENWGLSSSWSAFSMASPGLI